MHFHSQIINTKDNLNKHGEYTNNKVSNWVTALEKNDGWYIYEKYIKLRVISENFCDVKCNYLVLGINHRSVSEHLYILQTMKVYNNVQMSGMIQLYIHMQIYIQIHSIICTSCQ